MTKKPENVNVGSVGHTSNVVKFQKKQSATFVKNALNDNIHYEERPVESVEFDTTNDFDFIKDENYNWDDLRTLNSEINREMTELHGSVISVIANPNVIVASMRKGRADEYSKLVDIFFDDMLEISTKLNNLLSEHQHLGGLIEDLDDFDSYNRIAISYHNLHSEALSVMGPNSAALTEMVTELMEGLNPEDYMSKEEIEELLNQEPEVVTEGEQVDE